MHHTKQLVVPIVGTGGGVSRGICIPSPLIHLVSSYPSLPYCPTLVLPHKVFLIHRRLRRIHMPSSLPPSTSALRCTAFAINFTEQPGQMQTSSVPAPRCRQDSSFWCNSSQDSRVRMLMMRVLMPCTSGLRWRAQACRLLQVCYSLGTYPLCSQAPGSLLIFGSNFSQVGCSHFGSHALPPQTSQLACLPMAHIPSCHWALGYIDSQGQVHPHKSRL